MRLCTAAPWSSGPLCPIGHVADAVSHVSPGARTYRAGRLPFFLLCHLDRWTRIPRVNSSASESSSCPTPHCLDWCPTWHQFGVPPRQADKTASAGGREQSPLQSRPRSIAGTIGFALTSLSPYALCSSPYHPHRPANAVVSAVTHRQARRVHAAGSLQPSSVTTALLERSVVSSRYLGAGWVGSWPFQLAEMAAPPSRMAARRHSQLQ
jgi:hypothetical protein